MNSTRLPGKVMIDLLGKPIIHHIYDRLRTCKKLDDVVISTGPYNLNKKICDYAKTNKIPIFSGNEIDLIDRLYKTALKFEATAIVRITSDCPLVEPSIVDDLITKFERNSDNFDIVTNCKKHTFHHGLEVEVYSVGILKKLFHEISEIKFREWFPIYIQKHPNDFKILNIENEINLSNLRLTLDYADDLKLIKIIYETMPSNVFSFSDVMKLLDSKPELLEINKKYLNHKNIDAPS